MRWRGHGDVLDVWRERAVTGMQCPAGGVHDWQPRGKNVVHCTKCGAQSTTGPDKTLAMALGLAGLGALLTAVTLRLYSYQGYHLSTLHAVCQSWFGQTVQAAHPVAANECMLVSAGEQAAGWSLVTGIVLLAAAVVTIAWKKPAVWGTDHQAGRL